MKVPVLKITGFIKMCSFLCINSKYKYQTHIHIKIESKKRNIKRSNKYIGEN